MCAKSRKENWEKSYRINDISEPLSRGLLRVDAHAASHLLSRPPHCHSGWLVLGIHHGAGGGVHAIALLLGTLHVLLLPSILHLLHGHAIHFVRRHAHPHALHKSTQ